MSLRNFVQNMNLVSCSPEVTIDEIAELMGDEDVGSILVIENGKPQGIITDRDIVMRCVRNRADCALIPAADVMSSPVETVDINCGIHDLIDRMSTNNIRRIVVVDETGDAIGVISSGDVYELLTKEMGKLCAFAPHEEKLISARAS